jgi:glycosyltransferase involved in cell wall biosynthesis
MKRIGLLLASDPFFGGTFQYNLSILEALATLSSEHFKVIVLYANPVWEDHLKAYSFEVVYAAQPFSGFISRVYGKAVRAIERIHELLHLPRAMGGGIANLFDPIERKLYKRRSDLFARKLVKQGCDLWIFPSQDAWSYRAGVPALVAIHDLMHRYQGRFPEVSENGEYEWRENNYLNICRTAKGILVDSLIGQQHVHESYGTPNDRIFVLPFVPPRYIYARSGSVTIAEKYHLPRKYIFYPAQFWAHKNHANLVRAIALVRGICPDINLVLVGAKKNAFIITKRLVEELDLDSKVHFIGYVPNEEIPSFYRHARALIMPTFFGPTNIPPLEAFVLCCPVAVSNIYGMPEQVGDAALLFNPESVQEIAECIVRLWTDDQLCNDLIVKGQKRAAQWGQAQFSERLCQIITELSVSRSNLEHY